MLRYIVVFYIIIIHCSAHGFSKEIYQHTSVPLSDQTKVSVITCGPGKEIYSVFGHTALRIADPANRFDKVYNYGTFDFNTPDFALKFARGNLAYFLSVTSFDNFVYAYQIENRSLSEQVLQISREQAQQIYNALEVNLQPDNKYYRYQFFSDNCTTRIYNLLVESLNGHITTDTSYIGEQTSYRQLFNPYLENFPWVRLGMNIGLGIETDQKVSFKQRLFLPATLEQAISYSYLTNNNMPLVAEVNSLYSPIVDIQEQSSFTLSPLLLLNIFACMVISFSLLIHQKPQSKLLLDDMVFGSTGVAGVILLLLWIFSLHTPTYQNLNLLWLNPLNLLFIFVQYRWQIFTRYYIQANILLLSLLIAANLLWNLFVLEIYPVALMLTIRFWMNLKTASASQLKKLT